MPRPLVLVLLVVAALGIAWNLAVPFNQAPDEFAHMGYTQHLSETGSLPGSDPKAPPISSEEAAALEASNGLRTPGLADVKTTWSPRVFDAWRAADADDTGAARRDGSGPNPASSNPPLYYLTTAPAYLLGSPGDFFTRVGLVRLVSLAWLLLAVAGAWLLAGEVFRRDRLLQTTAAGVVGLAPMAQFIGNSVNPDPAVMATWALAFWLGVRVLRRGLTPARAGALFLVVGLACVVKATSYALVPGAVVVLAVAAWRVRRPSGRAAAVAPVAAHRLPATQGVARRRVLGSAAASAAALAVTFGAWIVVSRLSGTATSAQAAEVGATPINVRQFLSYVWQFYLPDLPFLKQVSGAPDLPLYDVLIQGAWGRFGWLEVAFPGWVYAGLTVLTALVVLLLLAGTWRDRRRIDPAVAAFFVLVVVALMAGLHVTEYQKGGINFIQGRYLLPVLPLAGLAVARSLRFLPARRVAQGAGVVLAGLLVLNLFGLGLVLERFYA